MEGKVNCSIMIRYHIKKKLGSGTFGNVFLVSSSLTTQDYALKQIRVAESDLYSERISSREYHINKYLLENSDETSRSYFINMSDQFYTVREEESKRTFWNNIVLEYYGSSLSHNLPSTLELKLNYIHQLITEIAHLHKLHIIHRDLKPSNILVKNQQLKLCDFGCSKHIEGNIESHRSTPLVTSRFYRAPELLMGTTRYGYAIDIWSLGCVIAEIMLGTPLFIALDSDTEQLLSIFNILGVPSEEDLAQMQIPKQNREYISTIKPIQPISLSILFPKDTPIKIIRLVDSIFQYNPSQRPTAEQLLQLDIE